MMHPLFTCGLCGFSLMAAPVFAQSITPSHGSNTVIQYQGQTYQIQGGTQAGTNLFHSFQQFSLSAGEIAQFLTQPEIVNILGRVTGGDPSVINGLIQVSGSQANLYLMNPAGIIFGPGARLDVPGSFTATTGDRIGFSGGWFNATGPNDYPSLTGNPQLFSFLDQGGVILNQGDLAVNSGASLNLIGGQVLNTGRLTAPGGTVLITAVEGSQRVRVGQPGHLLSLEIEPDRSAVDRPLKMQDLPQLLTGKGIDPGLSVTATGAVTLENSTLAIPTQGGTAIASGTISTDNFNDPAGNIGIFGAQIALVDAQITANGSPGGTILIGGEEQGRGPVPNATHLFIDPETQIKADGVGDGDGGRVILFASDTAQIFGQVSAKGGEAGGNGGFVETSGLQNLAIARNPNITAPQGQAGTWLIDPNNIEIGNFGSENISVSNPFVSANDGAELDIAILLNALLSGGTVIVETGTEGTNSEAGNITLLASLEYQTPNNDTTLILRAHNSIFINAPIYSASTSQGLNLILMADSDQNGMGLVEITNFINTDQGFIQISGTSNNNLPGVFLTDASLNTLGGNIEISGSSAGDVGIFLDGPITSNGGNITLNSPQGITVTSLNSGDLDGVAGDITVTAGGFFRATEDFYEPSLDLYASVGAVGFTGNGAITITHGGNGDTPFIVGDASINGTVSAITNGDYTIEPTQSFIGNYTLGNVQIRTGTAATPIGGEPPQPACSLDCPESSEGLAPSEVNELRTDTDRLITAESAPLVMNENLAQTILQNIAQATGVRPAILYAGFVPAGVMMPPTVERWEANLAAAVRSQFDPIQAVPTDTTLNLEPQGSDRLQLLLITANGEPTVQTLPITRREVEGMVGRLRRGVSNSRSQGYLAPAQQLYQWLIAPLEATLTEQEINNLVLIGDQGLRSLPLAALHDGNNFIIERYSIGQMPSLALTNFDYQPITATSPVLAMGASEFSAPNLEPLPAVPTELAKITQQRGGHIYLNQNFTWRNLKARNQNRQFQILHLATHAFFDPNVADNAYIQLWGDEILTLPSLRALKPYQAPELELLILSACTTAIGNPEAELGFAGAAVQAGVKSVLASLWQVSDVGTAILMDGFYQQLAQADVTIKAEALRRAQLALITPAEDNPDGPNFSHPFYWSAFNLIGSPW
ncbi:MAG: CHAT domain-containing protein [Spirulina sp. DLM2.Bin59]|nr:MAG: CHAT domain-containing protein [Spirulina sp. DLM2.Bin59]